MPMSHNGLTKLAEECGELTQITAKKIAFYDQDIHPDGESMSKRMVEEMGDVLATIEFVSKKFDLDRRAIKERMIKKLNIFWGWDKDPNS